MPVLQSLWGVAVDSHPGMVQREARGNSSNPLSGPPWQDSTACGGKFRFSVLALQGVKYRCT